MLFKVHLESQGELGEIILYQVHIISHGERIT